MTSATTASWKGGASPWGMSWQKLMMWWFIVTDALLFVGFLASYGFTRAGSTNWPDQSKVFAITLISIMTFTLISSSATMACAVGAARAGDRDKVMKYLLFTFIGGAIFLGLQGYEWTHFIADGWRPWAAVGGLDRSFAAYFFLITGFHGTHVLIGLIVLAVTLLGAINGKVNPNGVEVAGLYWHFVDLVWVFIFGCFYLI
jgi:cytochrome c oxidase subunit 3